MTITDELRDPLLVWGEYPQDALRVRSEPDLEVALDALHAIASLDPVSLRLWSARDAQLLAVINGHECALYVLTEQGYGTSVGDPTRTQSFELIDHDVGTLAIPWSDCVPWRVARPALLRFAAHGELGDQVIVEGRIPSQLLALGDCDRSAELATRAPPPADPARTSLPHKAPQGGWAERLLRGLIELQLIEVDIAILEALTAQVAILLTRWGEDAQDSLETAQRLTRELARMRGVGALFATAGDLQIALRRTQDPPTQPVEVPFG